MLRILTWRISSNMSCQFRQLSSSPYVKPQVVSSTLCSQVDKDSAEEKLEKDKPASNKLVSAAFEKLKSLRDTIEIDDTIIKTINAAKNVEELLSIVSTKRLTKNHALKLVSVLADWTVEGRTQTSEFEKDSRFAIVCRILGSSPKESRETERPPSGAQSTDLVTVLGIANGDEAAKLVANISLPQMVKVLSTLASQKRRSTHLLRSLAFNISGSTEKLDIKQGADALYAMASLSYHDEMLADKVCADLCDCLMANKRRAVVGSIITSLGLMRYKHIELLDLLSEWVLVNTAECTPQDLTSLMMSLAAVNHTPVNYEKLFPLVQQQVSAGGPPEPQAWLDLVWSLAVLQHQTTEQCQSVLSAEFIDKLKALNPDGLSIPTKLKLLNINGVARLKEKNYKGPLLDVASDEWKIPLLRSKEKQALVTSVQESMLNLLPSAIYLNTNIDTSMGFMIDAECLMTSKMAPLPLFDKKTKAPIDRSPDMQKGIKLAILVWDYHDMTHGRRELTGVNTLCQELVKLKGYRVMTVDYVDFNAKSVLVSRVQYLNQKLKALMGKS